jgi:diguanylate cyclase (GGDEF)-like protein
MSISKAPVILLIEDDPVGISSLAGILGDRVELVVCKTLTDARRLLTDEIDLILLDLYLPDGSGIEFLNYLKNQTDYESLPVMCISSSDRIQDIEQAFQHGATDYVLKPFNKTIISAKIATLVDLKRKTDQLAAAALSDPLTNIGNRRLFDRQLDSEWHRASRLNSFVGLILIDVDNFKQINDQLGHGQGDRCLQVLADTLSLRFARAGDITARLGGDEFAVIMPGANLKGTITAANTLLTLLHSSQSTTITTRRKNPAFTVSIGCWAMQPTSSEGHSELVSRADQNLYQAKEEGGRDCVRPIIDGV